MERDDDDDDDDEQDTPPQGWGPRPTFFVVYTDGACHGNPGPGGWAAVHPGMRNTAEEEEDGEVAEAASAGWEICGGELETTNNRMELRAAIEGMRRAAQTAPPGVIVQLFTDSNYVLRGASSWMQGWKANGWTTANNQPVKNKDLWQELDATRSELLRGAGGRTLRWVWVKGHAGHRWNERADALAGQGLEARLHQGGPLPPPPRGAPVRASRSTPYRGGRGRGRDRGHRSSGVPPRRRERVAEPDSLPAGW